jgi:hypothetical protein
VSQHYYETAAKDRELRILAGWDRPLQGFFLVIMDSDGEVLASNLELPVSHPKNFSEFKPFLDKYGIVLPDEMVDEIIDDGASNMGNRVVWHYVIDGVHSRDVKR